MYTIYDKLMIAWFKVSEFIDLLHYLFSRSILLCRRKYYYCLYFCCTLVFGLWSLETEQTTVKAPPILHVFVFWSHIIHCYAHIFMTECLPVFRMMAVSQTSSRWSMNPIQSDIFCHAYIYFQEYHKRINLFPYHNFANFCKYDIFTNVFRIVLMEVRFRKIVGKSNFSEQFRKLINRYKRIGYSLDIRRQTTCLVINSIIVDGYASLFNCTAAVRASDSMTAAS